MTIPNLITIMRALLVPAIVWGLMTGQFVLAFLLFVIAGVSDAVDGIIARHFGQHSELGAILDPLADKVMLVSVYVVLAFLEELPLWLVILVVSRDVLIVTGVMVAGMIGDAPAIRPLWVSKANTVAQIVLAAFVLATLASALDWPMVRLILVWTTGALTTASTVAYIVEGLRLLDAGSAHSPKDR